MVLLSMLTTNAVHAADNRYYVGLGVGAGVNYFDPDFQLFPISNARHGALAGSLFFGYALNRYADIEMGITDFGRYHNSGSSNAYFCISSDLRQCVPNPPDNHFLSENIAVKNTIQAYAIDLAVKWNWPVTTHFILFGKTGAAYIKARIDSVTRVDINIMSNNTWQTIQTINVKSHASNGGSFWQKIKPMLGVGGEYYFNHALSARVEYDYYFPVKTKCKTLYNPGNLTPSIILASLVYHF